MQPALVTDAEGVSRSKLRQRSSDEVDQRIQIGPLLTRSRNTCITSRQLTSRVAISFESACAERSVIEVIPLPYQDSTRSRQRKRDSNGALCICGKVGWTTASSWLRRFVTLVCNYRGCG